MPGLSPRWLQVHPEVFQKNYWLKLWFLAFSFSVWNRLLWRCHYCILETLLKFRRSKHPIVYWDLVTSSQQTEMFIWWCNQLIVILPAHSLSAKFAYDYITTFLLTIAIWYHGGWRFIRLTFCFNHMLLYR